MRHTIHQDSKTFGFPRLPVSVAGQAEERRAVQTALVLAAALVAVLALPAVDSTLIAAAANAESAAAPPARNVP
jgi:hypothetical protein